VNRIARFSASVEAGEKSGVPGGSMRLIQDGTVVLVRAFDFKEIGGTTTPDADTLSSSPQTRRR
jgi:hypothetical protein